MKKIIIILVSLLIVSCEIDPEKLISVHIINHTNETISVNAGYFFPSATIKSGGGQSVLAEKGNSISIIGTSGRSYGSRTFYRDSQWDVY